MRLRLLHVAASPAAVVLAAAVAAGPTAAAATPCDGWSKRTVASGLGSLENLEPDGAGALFVSATTQKAILRLRPDGGTSVAVAGVEAPGGLRLRAGTLFFNNGDAAASGLLGRADGTLERLDVATGTRSVGASGLTMPNGLAFLPGGDAVVSRDLGSGTGVTRIPAGDPGHPQTHWADKDDTNGLAVDPTGTWLYADETFTAESAVVRIRIADPADIQVVARLGGAGVPKGLDDMTIDSAGILYLAANGAGEVLRLDPRDGSSCVLASGLQNPSAVKFGSGAGWPASHLFVTGFDGTVRELAPGQAPPGSTPATGTRSPPAARGRIRLTASRRRVAVGGRRRCVRFRARVAGRPLAGARVRFAKRTRRTGAAGGARFCLRFRVAMDHRAVARKAGLRPGSVVVRARR